MSTVFVKQHYFLDTVFGIGIPLIIFIIVSFFNPGEHILRRIHNQKEFAKPII